MPEAEPLPYVLIESAAALAEAARAWVGLPALGLDTEFIRTNTFFHKLGLVQVSDGRTAWLVDPLAVGDLAPLVEVLRAPETVKVLHSASEDVEVFHHALGAVPAPLFDTQIAAALAGAGAFLSYQKLVAAFLEVELSKEETRTDWLARPLSPAQLTYAADDVDYLLPVYERLRATLAALGRLEWAFEDSSALLDTSRFEEDAGSAWLRLKGAGRLNRRQLAAVQRLAAWREREARRRDLPRGFVLKDDALLAMASRRPTDAQELQRIPGLDPRRVARDARAWLDLLAEADALPEAELPERTAHVPFSPALKKLTGRLRQEVRAKAEALSIPPEVLAPRRTLDALVRTLLEEGRPRLPPDFAGWRREVVGEALLAEVDAAAEEIVAELGSRGGRP